MLFRSRCLFFSNNGRYSICFVQPEQGLLLTVFFFFVSLEFSVIKRFLKEEDEKEEEEGKGEEEL